MSLPPYPIVKCPAGAVRNDLLRELTYRSGFTGAPGWTNSNLIDARDRHGNVHEHLCMTRTDDRWYIGQSCEVSMRLPWSHSKVLLNSPRAFLRYIDRHNICP
jgi:uridine phosphorylase